MELLEFARNYFKNNHRRTDLKPYVFYHYQEKLLKQFELNDDLAILKSRQVGMTTLLLIYCAHFLLYNKSINNIIYFKSHSLHLTRISVRLITEILQKSSCKEINYVKNNSDEILLNNGNSIRILKGTKIKDFENVKTLLVDEAAHVDDLKTIMHDLDLLPVKIRLILSSTDTDKINHFYDGIFKDDNSKMFKIKVHYSEDPDLIERSKEMEKFLSENDFNREMELLDVPKRVKILESIKSKKINVRFDDNLLNKIGSRLIDLDVNISDYIRDLVEKDLVPKKLLNTK